MSNSRIVNGGQNDTLELNYSNIKEVLQEEITLKEH